MSAAFSLGDPYEDEDWGSDEIRALSDAEFASIRRDIEESGAVYTIVHKMLGEFRYNPVKSSKKALSELMSQLGITPDEAWERIRSEALYYLAKDPIAFKILEGMTTPP